jgi:hypothetical protein
MLGIVKQAPPFLIVADQAQMKSYFVDEAQPKLRLVEAVEFPPEKTMVEPKPVEEGTGVLPQIAAKISQWLQEQKPDHWGFAAPADLNERILNLLDETLRRALTVNVREDLTNVPVEKLPERFEQPEMAGAVAKTVPGPRDAI